MRTRLFIALVLALAIVLTGCNTADTTGQTASAPTAATAVLRTGTDVRTLALGTLALDGSANAVDAPQATELLTLWKAYRALINNDATAQAELAAVLKEIAGTLTATQLEAIQTALQDPESQSTLAARFGLEMPTTGAGPGGAMAEDMTEEELEAIRAERQATAAVAGTVPGAAVPGAGGGVGMGRGGGVPPTGAEGFVNPGIQGAAAGVSMQSGASTWVSSLVEAVITYLEERAAAR